MLSRRPLLKKQIEYAQTQTKSHWSAARFLNVTYKKYKEYAIAYGLFYTEHFNQLGIGIRRTKFHGKPSSRPLQDIFDGKSPNYNRRKLFRRLVHAGLLEQKCAYCGINHTRPNGKGPYRLDYRDGDGDNLALENLQIICFNCRYLTRGDVLVPVESEDSTLVVNDDIINANNVSEEELLKFRDELQSDQFNKNEDAE